MIRLNVALRVKPENREKLVEVLLELSSKSCKEKGCMGYDAFSNLTDKNRFEIIETWENAAVLEAHQKTEHFTRLVPQMIALSEEKQTDKFFV